MIGGLVFSGAETLGVGALIDLAVPLEEALIKLGLLLAVEKGGVADFGEDAVDVGLFELVGVLAHDLERALVPLRVARGNGRLDDGKPVPRRRLR